jgi:hypothetical protein
MPRKKRADGTRAPNGTSTIYFGKDGYWHGRVTMGVLDNGKPDRRHVKRKDEGDAIRAVRALEKQRDSGRIRKPGRAWTLERWLTHWLEHIITPSVRPNTAARYRTDVVEYLIPGLGAHRLSGARKLEPEHIEKLYANLRNRKPPLSPSSVYHVHATLRTSLNEAVKRRHIGENPAMIARATTGRTGNRATEGRGSTSNYGRGRHSPEWRPLRSGAGAGIAAGRGNRPEMERLGFDCSDDHGSACRAAADLAARLR